MNSRVKLQDVADKLALALPGTKVGTAYDADFISTFGRVFPAAWVVGQRLRPADNGRGYAGYYRQTVNVEIVVRIVVQKTPDTDDVDTRLSSLQNAVADALIGWKPTNAARHLVWDLAQDGPPHEGVVTADLIFVTQVVYTKNA